MSPRAHGVQSSTSVHGPARTGSLRPPPPPPGCSLSVPFFSPPFPRPPLPLSFPFLSDEGSLSPESSAPALALNFLPPPTAANSASPSSV